MRAEKLFPSILHTDKKEDQERPQKVAGANGVNVQKAEYNSLKPRKKVNHKPAETQPRNIHFGKDGQTTATPKPTAKAGTAPKTPAAPQKSVKGSSDPKISFAAQPKAKGANVSSGRQRGREGDEADEAVGGGSISQKRKRG